MPAAALEIALHTPTAVLLVNTLKKSAFSTDPKGTNWFLSIK